MEVNQRNQHMKKQLLPAGFNKTPRKYFEGFVTNSTLFHKSYKRFADALHKLTLSTTLDSSGKARIEKQILLERELLNNWMDTFQTANNREARYRTSIVKRTSTGSLITQLQPFEIRWNESADSQTVVKAGWTDNNLHLRITTPEQALIKEGAFARNDLASFSNGLEIYIQPDSTKPEFYRLQINPGGTFIDAKTYSGIVYDSSWNAPVSVWTGNNYDTLVYNVQIPFNALGISAVEGRQFHLSVRRKAANGAITGWPEAQSNYVGLFSLVMLVNSIPVDSTIVKENNSNILDRRQNKVANQSVTLIK